MTMNEQSPTEPSALDKRVELINEALHTLDRAAPREIPRPVIEAVLTLVGVFLVSVAEIAASVGKVAELTENEFNTQLEAAMEAKRKDEPARKFFGQPAK